MFFPDTLLGGALLLWFILTGLSLIVLIYDLQTNTPAQWVMKLAWILIVLYTGPVGLIIFFLSCRQPLPGTHDDYIAAHWKQSVGSMMHCVAGDATGIILAAIVTFQLAFPNGLDLIIEYISAYIIGLLIFQALFMKSMMGGNYYVAIKKTIFAETVSMNMVMVGMIPVMAIMRGLIPGGGDPEKPIFWGISAIATMAGMITAYPINSWMVGKGLKHGMMSAVTDASKSMDMSEHKESEVTLNTKLGVVVLTFAILGVAIWITSFFIELKL
ncbi:MAG: DUF4396 domain-containing protein [Thermodesulfobacteriota bacterium]